MAQTSGARASRSNGKTHTARAACETDLGSERWNDRDGGTGLKKRAESGSTAVDQVSAHDASPISRAPAAPDRAGLAVTHGPRVAIGGQPLQQGAGPIERNIRHDLVGKVEPDYAHDGFIATFSSPQNWEQAT